MEAEGEGGEGGAFGVGVEGEEGGDVGGLEFEGLVVGEFAGEVEVGAGAEEFGQKGAAGSGAKGDG